MADIRDILESWAAAGWKIKGTSLEPVPAASVEPETLFLNSDGQDQLCFKDRDGIVHEVRTRPA